MKKYKFIAICVLTILILIQSSFPAFALTTINASNSIGCSNDPDNSKSIYDSPMVSASDLSTINDVKYTIDFTGSYMSPYVTLYAYDKNGTSLGTADSFQPGITGTWPRDVNSFGTSSTGAQGLPSGTVYVKLELTTVSGSSAQCAYFQEVDTATQQLQFPATTWSSTFGTGVPSTPATPTDNGTGYISWPSEPDATGYNILDNGNNVGSVPASSTPQFNYNTLPAGTHTISVSAQNINGTSTPSGSVTVNSDGSGNATGGTNSGGTGSTTCSLWDVENAVNALGSQLATIISNQGTLDKDLNSIGDELNKVTGDMDNHLGNMDTNLENLSNYITTPTSASSLNTSSLGSSPTFDPTVPNIPGEPSTQPYIYNTPAPQLPPSIDSPSPLPSIPDPSTSVMAHDTPAKTDPPATLSTPQTPQTPTAAQTPVTPQSPLTTSPAKMDTPLTPSSVTMDPPLTPSTIQQSTPITPQTPVSPEQPYSMQQPISPK